MKKKELVQRLIDPRNEKRLVSEGWRIKERNYKGTLILIEREIIVETPDEVKEEKKKGK
jgi:hypothetical protein